MRPRVHQAAERAGSRWLPGGQHANRRRLPARPTGASRSEGVAAGLRLPHHAHAVDRASGARTDRPAEPARRGRATRGSAGDRCGGGVSRASVAGACDYRPLTSPWHNTAAGFPFFKKSGLMNLRRGLFRVWIVLSAVWSVGMFVTAYNAETNLAARTSFYHRWTWWFWSDWLLAILGPWMLTIAVFAVVWTVRGFRSR
jgi:hypothetical protein